MDRLECSVCYLPYAQPDRRPRVLPCGHTFCHNCLHTTLQVPNVCHKYLTANQIPNWTETPDSESDHLIPDPPLLLYKLGGSRKCPGCREVLKVTSATQVPINHDLEAIMALLCPPEEGGGACPPGLVKIYSTAKQNMPCPEHHIEVTHRCVTHKAWICKKCTEKDHPIGTCQVIHIDVELGNRKQDLQNSRDDDIKAFQRNVAQVEDFSKQLKFEEHKQEGIMKRLEALLQRHRDAKSCLEEKRESIRVALDAAWKKQEQFDAAKATLASATTLQEVTDATQLFQEEADSVKSFSAAFIENNIHITATLLSLKMRTITAWALDNMATNGTIDVAKNFSKEEKIREMLDVLKVVCGVLKPQEASEETIVAYAVQEDTGSSARRRAALLTLDGRWLHLHHLKDAPPPPHALILPYNAIRDLVKAASGLCFLDLGWPGSTRGRLHVRLFGDTGRANQFLYLCTGEKDHLHTLLLDTKNGQKGPSYTHTNFTALKNRNKPGEWLAGGDYDGKCARPLVEGLTEGEEYLKPKVAGLVGGVYAKGSNKNGLFGIWVREEASPKPCDLGFAKVEHGLAVLKSAAAQGNIKEVKVLDCGVVVPL